MLSQNFQGHTFLSCWIGSGQRYMICVTLLARCASQKTHGHARIARESENTRTCENSTRFWCDSRMSVCFLTCATCQKVLQNLIPWATAYFWMLKFSKKHRSIFYIVLLYCFGMDSDQLFYVVLTVLGENLSVSQELGNWQSCRDKGFLFFLFLSHLQLIKLSYWASVFISTIYLFGKAAIFLFLGVNWVQVTVMLDQVWQITFFFTALHQSIWSLQWLKTCLYGQGPVKKKAEKTWSKFLPDAGGGVWAQSPLPVTNVPVCQWPLLVQMKEKASKF